MVVAGAALLEKNREMVDALNVFPVPDGDTGTNMSLTMNAATKELNGQEYLSASDAANAFAKGALRGARGNSGVITSQLYRGFAKALEGVERITPMEFAQALKAGSDMAYKAMMKPKEGTILTVARVVAEDAMRQAALFPNDFTGLMNTILTSGEAILRRTPDMLPVLKQAGVVDAGGRGLLLIYTGYVAALRGETIDMTPVDFEGDLEEFIDDHESLEDIKFAYCTEFLVDHIFPTVTEQNIDTFKRRLNRIGDCVLVVGDLSLVKVHLHTNDPGKALQYALEMGELTNLKIDNMVEQKREIDAKREAEKANEEPKPYGMIAVSLGKGFSQIFKDLSVDLVVEGGQTMNPSIEDILDGINKINAECIFVFPNNGNVILAAQQAAELAEKPVFVIPTKNVAMGIAAAVAFQGELSGEENAQRMESASQGVKTATVTYAVRDSEYNDLHINQGDIIGLNNGQIESTGDSVKEVALNLLENIINDNDELITVYYGQDTSEEEAEELTNMIEKRYGDCDVEMHSGGQPLYYYLISVE